MKIRNFYLRGIGFLCLFLITQVAIGQNGIKSVAISEEKATVQMDAETPSSYLIEIGGPDGYYSKQTVDYTNEISLQNIRTNGEKFKDGIYSLQITPILTLTEEQRAALSVMRAANDAEGMAAYRSKHNLPENVDQFSMNFSIRNGDFVVSTKQEGKLNLPSSSSQWELNHPSLYASINPIGLDYEDHAMDNTALNAAVAQTFATDVIVQGSICVGLDCSTSESFGFDTQRLKENNLRIHFNDTSSSASFPSNDWRIAINDSSNGGANYYAVEDATAGTTPFRIEAGAGNNALHIDQSGGNVGMGTSTPVVELQVADGDSPTLRLEQNGSSGWTPQTWDVVGNETNFFVRDVTNGSALPFRIRPGANQNAIYIDNDDQIGMYTPSPKAALDINSTDAILIPRGTVAERPTGREGMLRANLDNNTLEYHNGSAWAEVGAGGGSSGIFGSGVANNIPKFATGTSLSNSDIYNNANGVSIGHQSPGKTLDVGGDLRIRGDMATLNFYRTSSPSDIAFIQYDNSAGEMNFSTNTKTIRFNNGSGFSETMRISNTGRVGIGCTNPSSELHVNGTISTTAATVSTSIACSSDERFKKNISPLQSSLEKVLNLQGVNYDWRIDEFPSKNFNEGQQIGFIAQEIEEVLPLVVQTDAEGYKAVDYSRLTPVLVEAVKEQQAIIDAQQNEIDALQTQLASLEELKAQVAQLTQMVMKQADDKNNESAVGEE